MQAFRLLTTYYSEKKNDKYAGIVIERFRSFVNDVEVTFISDSLGTTFFVQDDRNKTLSAVCYVVAIEYLDSLTKAVYSRTRIAEDLRLI